MRSPDKPRNTGENALRGHRCDPPGPCLASHVGAVWSEVFQGIVPRSDAVDVHLPRTERREASEGAAMAPGCVVVPTCCDVRFSANHPRAGTSYQV